GLPVVATAVGGNPEVVDGNISGLLVPPRSPGQLAQAMARMIEEPGMRARMGECGADRVRRTFSQDASLAAYLQLYETCRHGHSSLTPGSLCDAAHGAPAAVRRVGCLLQRLSVLSPPCISVRGYTH